MMPVVLQQSHCLCTGCAMLDVQHADQSCLASPMACTEFCPGIHCYPVISMKGKDRVIS